MEEQRFLDQVSNAFPGWAVFEVSEQDVTALDHFLSINVGPRTFWIHDTISGPGWQVWDTQKRNKIVMIADKKLATFLRLKLT